MTDREVQNNQLYVFLVVAILGVVKIFIICFFRIVVTIEMDIISSFSFFESVFVVELVEFLFTVEENFSFEVLSLPPVEFKRFQEVIGQL